MSDATRAMREQVLQVLGEPGYQPLDRVGISEKIGLPAESGPELRNVLRGLEQEGVIARIRKDRYVLPEEAESLHRHPAAFARRQCLDRLPDGAAISVPYGGMPASRCTATASSRG